MFVNRKYQSTYDASSTSEFPYIFNNKPTCFPYIFSHKTPNKSIVFFYKFTSCESSNKVKHYSLSLIFKRDLISGVTGQKINGRRFSTISFTFDSANLEFPLQLHSQYPEIFHQIACYHFHC